MKSGRCLIATVVLVFGQSLIGCAGRCETCCSQPVTPQDGESRTVTHLGDDVSPLIEAFNGDADSWRLVALVSPTCSECVYGAEAVKKEITDRYGPDRVGAFIVWIPMIDGDSEETAHVAATIFPKNRVTHYYDSQQTVGWGYSRGTFAGFIGRARDSLPANHPMAAEFEDRRHVERPQWDLYMLYAPGVRWDTDEGASGPPMPTHWVRHCGRRNGKDSTYWRDSPDKPPLEGNLFAAIREMIDQAVVDTQASGEMP
jgi:hypothetical protein